MTTKMICLLVVSTFTCSFFACKHNSIEKPNKLKSDFSLSITTFNHAQRISEGTTTLTLEKGVLTISKQFLLSDKDTVIFSKTLDNHSIDAIESIGLDSLKENYFNRCVMLTSGNKYFISTTIDKVEKEVFLHHYYNEQIEKLINELNKNIPSNFQLHYVSKNTEQDCD